MNANAFSTLYWLSVAGLAFGVGCYATSLNGRGPNWLMAVVCGSLCFVVYLVLDRYIRRVYSALTQDRSDAIDEFRRRRAPLDDEPSSSRRSPK